MDPTKIAFIICTNNELYCNECVWYIDQLTVPDGYSTDIISISGAESICAAYNAAMKSSDAKYKIYLHQDTFIYHRGFLTDILNEFQSDPSLGMLGVIGGVNLPPDAVMWNAKHVGTTYACDYNETFCLNLFQQEAGRYTEAEMLDGMLLVTQYDIDWREDLDLGWDFYDVSQSLEFRRAGYKIGIPHQSSPWCLHDCGHSKLSRYDDSRRIILKEYPDFFPGTFVPNSDTESLLWEEKIFSSLLSLIEKDDLLEAFKIRSTLNLKRLHSNNLQYALNILEIYGEEQIGEVRTPFFKSGDPWEQIKRKYDSVKFTLRHIERDTDPEQVALLTTMLQEKALSKEAVWVIARHCVLDRYKVFCKLLH